MSEREEHEERLPGAVFRARGPGASSAADAVYRCAVVADTSGRSLLAEVLRALRGAERLKAVRMEDADGAGDWDAVIFVSAGGGLAATLEEVHRWRAARPSIAILLAVTGVEPAQTALLLAHGVSDFILFPATHEEVVVRVQRAVGMHPPELRPAPRVHPRLGHFIGTHPLFLREVNKLPVYAGCEAGVLIIGETGTGKEVCAQAVHCLSPRAAKPWVAVNCGAMPTELVEDELFGHARGAFTTAHAKRAGLVSDAEGGTLFLDDIDCLPMSAQAKLLRFLQEREYRPVGSNALQRADVRVIAAGNDRLPAMVARGEFRQDLFFRLNVLVLHLPPLRERREDIPALALHFLRHFSAQHGRRVDALAPRALERLFAHSWAGNVRELQHVMERAVLLAAGPVLREQDIDLPVPAVAEAPDAPESLRAAKGRIVRQFERSYIEHLLACCDGNVTHAARQAGKNRRAFFELMRKHEIAAATFRPQAGEPRTTT